MRLWAASFAALFFVGQPSAAASKVAVEEVRVVGPGAGAMPALPAPPVKLQLSAPALSAPKAPALTALAPSVAAAPNAVAAAYQPAAAIAALPALPISAVPAAAPVSPEAAAPSAPALEELPSLQAAERGGAPARESAWASAKRWLKHRFQGEDQLPGWPPKEGAKVKLSGRTWTIRKELAEGGGSKVFDTDNPMHVVKVVHPEFKGLPHYSEEREALQALARTKVAHSGLVAASADGMVLVKEKIDGESREQLQARKHWTGDHQLGYGLLASQLIAAGYTADLIPSNLIWERWRSRWTLIDAGGARPGRPSEVLRQLFTGPLSEGMDKTAVLRGLRGHLGPESAAWARTVEDGRADAALAPAFAALSAFDAKLALPAAIEFQSEAPKGILDDSKVSAKEARKRLGYAPWDVEDRQQLKFDDAKLNTDVVRLHPKDKAPVVLKKSNWGVIRNELFVRKVVHRWFARYFETPAALAVEDGYDSWMVMESASGAPSYFGTKANLEQRVALALLVHSFALSDMNEGNVLYPQVGRPVLIDFEQALGTRDPNTSRVPDERIALEMPWMSRAEPNVPEKYYPAASAWRALLARPGTQAELREMLLESGFKASEAEQVMASVRYNVSQLEAVILADAQFVNRFVRTPKKEK